MFISKKRLYELERKIAELQESRQVFRDALMELSNDESVDKLSNGQLVEALWEKI